jgi:hypothetical protein
MHDDRGIPESGRPSAGAVVATRSPMSFARTRERAWRADGGCSMSNRSQSRYLVSMTAKDKLRRTVEELSEAEAQDTLGFIVHRRDKRDALAELFERAPLDDEPTTPEEDEGVREAREQILRGEVLSADEIRREIA